MRFSGTACAVFSLSDTGIRLRDALFRYNALSDGLHLRNAYLIWLSVPRLLAYRTVYNIQVVRFLCIGYAVIGFPVVSLSDGLQSSRGGFSPVLSMQLLTSQLLAYWAVYNHPRDVFVLH